MPGQPARRQTQAERTRAEILAVAVPLAARIGLEGLSIGLLATELGMSKGGVFAHFGSKEALQLATVDAAFEEFSTEVMGPALEMPAGAERLQVMFNAYFDYVLRRVDRGGCFFTAASLEFDDQPGKVRDRIAAVLQTREELVTEELRKAKSRRQLSGDAAQLAFEVIALATGANVQFQLSKDPEVFRRVRTALEAKLGLGA